MIDLKDRWIQAFLSSRTGSDSGKNVDERQTSRESQEDRLGQDCSPLYRYVPVHIRLLPVKALAHVAALDHMHLDRDSHMRRRESAVAGDVDVPDDGDVAAVAAVVVVAVDILDFPLHLRHIRVMDSIHTVTDQNCLFVDHKNTYRALLIDHTGMLPKIGGCPAHRAGMACSSTAGIHNS